MISSISMRPGWYVVARAIVVGLVFLIIAPGRSARAAGEDDAGGDWAAVQTLIADAVAEYDAGHFQEARALFRRAQQQSPSARTLRGIGMASFELREYVEATRALTEALREQRHALSAEQRQHVQGLLARADAYVGHFALRLRPASATVVVDDLPAEVDADGTLLLPFGRHHLIARCPTCTPSEREIEVSGGERQILEIALEPLAPPRLTVEPPATVRTTVVPPIERVEAPAPKRSHAAYWVGGAALLSAGGTVAGALWWLNRSNELDTCRNAIGAGNACPNESTLSAQRNAAAGVTLGLGAAAVTTTIAATILWSHRTPATEQKLACGGSFKEVFCALRF
jgi:hypothetical protein